MFIFIFQSDRYFERKVVLCALFVLFMLGGCNAFHEITHPDELRITSDELAGVWTFNSHTLGQINRLKTLGLDKLAADDNLIELRNDGSCKFRSYTAFQNTGKYLVSDGTWRLERTYDDGIGGETWKVDLELTPTPTNFVGVYFLVKKRGSSLILYDFFDDLDLNQFVEFEKKETA